MLQPLPAGVIPGAGQRKRKAVTKRETPLELPLRMGQMRPGQSGWICQVEGQEESVRRLLELGLVEDSWVEVVHEAPFGGDPIAVKVRGGLLALRRQEADQILVRKGDA